MKKILLLVSLTVVISLIPISCSRDGSAINMLNKRNVYKEDATVIAEVNGETYYYKTGYEASEYEDSTTALAEFVTDKGKKSVKAASGKYVTTKSTEVVTHDNTTVSFDDNEVLFESPYNGTTNNSATEKESSAFEYPTDSDGWIDRWY